MRRRLLLVALLAGGLAIAGGVALGAPPASVLHAPTPATALGRADVADVPAPTVLTRVRDSFGRQHDVRRDVAATLGIALVLTLAGGWWLARERAARVRHVRPLSIRRTRAPPWMPANVNC
jgi:hypothetical protein